MARSLAARLLIAALAAGAFSALPGAVGVAAAQQQTLSFDIREQSLSAALVEFSRRSGAADRALRDRACVMEIAVPHVPVARIDAPAREIVQRLVGGRLRRLFVVEDDGELVMQRLL